MATAGVAACPELNAPGPVPERQLGLVRHRHVAARSVEVDRTVVRGANRARDVARDTAERRPVRTTRLVHDRSRRLPHPVPGDGGVLGDRVYVGVRRLCSDVLAPQGAPLLRRIGARVLRRGRRRAGCTAQLPVIDHAEARSVAGADVQRPVRAESQVAGRVARELLAPVLDEDCLSVRDGRAVHREA